MQLVASALGHKSLASYQTSAEEPTDLSGTPHVVIDGALLLQRMQELGYDYAEESVVSLVRDSIRIALPGTQVHWDEAVFADEMKEFIENSVSNSAHVLSVIAGEANGTPGHAHVPFEISLTEIPLNDFDTFTVRGTIAVDQDLERPYAGDRVCVEASILLTRLGRRGVGQPECTLDFAYLQYDEDEGDIEEPSACET